jgi:hypothetical protein
MAWKAGAATSVWNIRIVLSLEIIYCQNVTLLAQRTLTVDNLLWRFDQHHFRLYFSMANDNRGVTVICNVRFILNIPNGWWLRSRTIRTARSFYLPRLDGLPPGVFQKWLARYYYVYFWPVDLASLGILLIVAGQACPYALSREIVFVGWWKRGWELGPILTSKIISVRQLPRRHRGVY